MTEFQYTVERRGTIKRALKEHVKPGTNLDTVVKILEDSVSISISVGSE